MSLESLLRLSEGNLLAPCLAEAYPLPAVLLDVSLYRFMLWEG